MFYLSGLLVLAYMVLYEPNFSLMFLIHLFLYAGVYGIIIPKNGWINSNIKTLSLGRWASTKQIQTCTNIYSEQTCLLLCEDKNLHTKYKNCLASLLVRQKPRQRHKLSYSHDALQTSIWEDSFKKMRFRSQRIHWFLLVAVCNNIIINCKR